MINALTYGLGAELGKKIRLAYFEKERFLENHDSYLKFKLEEKLLYKDILALSVFHQYAIGPLHGSAEFMNSTKQYGVKSIAMGSFKFDAKMRKISLGITKAFFDILLKYQISIEQLNVGSTSEFIEINRAWVSKRSNE